MEEIWWSWGLEVWRHYKDHIIYKGFPNALTATKIADEYGEQEQLSKYEQLLQYIQLSYEASIKETKTANALTFLFDRFGLWLLYAYLRDSNYDEKFPLNAMVG